MKRATEKTAWMWLSGDALRGLSLDPDDGTLVWIGQAGCHCSGEDEIVQSREQYEKEGAPALIGALPEEIAQEVRRALAPAEARRGGGSA